ncbi:hypothetical protein [Rhodosalinus sediminis]|uniref:hypothetical protein n=1 Tax=Rhodosalinus sediminis TaxID=1940533 RepID=UPI0023538740|nr:hypothetical protein [Rhodosalinus sediminis]
MRYLLISTSLALASGTAVSADISYLESGIGVTFEGCDREKLINLKNGYVWECGEYGYTYHYGTMTVLEVNGTTKLCVGDVEEAIEEFPDGDCYSGTLYRW